MVAGFGCRVGIKRLFNLSQPLCIVTGVWPIHVVNGVAPYMSRHPEVAFHGDLVGHHVQIKARLSRLGIVREIPDEHFSVSLVPVFYRLHEGVGAVSMKQPFIDIILFSQSFRG